MKLLMTSMFVLMAMTEASKICKCRKPEYITAPPVTQVSDVAHKILQFVNENYKVATDPFVIGLQLVCKGARRGEFEIDQENKCFRAELKRGVFEVDGHDYEVDIELTGQATDLGPVNTICDCKQRTGKDKLDFCNVFLRQRIFERVMALACKLADNKPNYCCN